MCLTKEWSKWYQIENQKHIKNEPEVNTSKWSAKTPNNRILKNDIEEENC